MVLRIYLLFLSLFLVSATTAPPAAAELVDRVLAIVNNEAVLQSDVDAFYRTARLRKEIDPFFMLVEGIDGPNPERAKVLDYLIQERIIGQQIKVLDTDVDARVAEVMRNNQLTRESLDEFLRTKGFKYQDYYELTRIGLQKQQHLDRDVRVRVNISDDDVRNHYINTLTKVSGDPVEYALQLIVINTANYKSMKFALSTAQSALKAVNEGESFSDIAKRSSDDPSSANGGDIGFVAADSLNPALRDSLKSMKIGSVSKVINADNMLYIMKLNDMRSLHNEKLEAQKEQIREQLAKGEYRRQLQLWTERAKATAFVKLNP